MADFGRDPFADLITTRAYVGTNGSKEVVYSETEFLDEAHDRSFGYPRRGAAPACVNRCDSCGNEFTSLQASPFTDAPCPRCRNTSTSFVSGDQLDIAFVEVEEP